VFQIDAAGWLQPARHCPSSNCNERPMGAAIELLVIHNISLPPGRFGGGHIDALFTNCLDCSADPALAELAGLQVSAHLLIDRDGAVTQFVPFLLRAWHAGLSRFDGRDNCNDFSIGIELEGTDLLPYTTAQYETLARITVALRRVFPGIVPERIVGHSDIAPGRKSDPGAAFEWSRYRQRIGELWNFSSS
jgi:AmpD protein